MKSNLDKLLLLEPESQSNPVTNEVVNTSSKVLERIPMAKIELCYSPEIPHDNRIKVLGSEDAADTFRALWNPKTLELQEQMYVLFLNNSNQILGYYPHSQGGSTGTLADLRLILAAALGCGAVAMILGHNHPSGTTKPSESDKRLTKKLYKASSTIDIKLLDHIILTKENYYSFADQGAIQF